MELVPQVPEEERELAAALALGDRKLGDAERERLKKELRKVSKIAQELREEGREENRLEVAKAMQADGADIERIMRYTGLSAEELKKLRDASQN